MITATLDTRNFSKALKQYMVFQKRLPSDVVNAKLYFIARNATVTTKHSSPEAIRQELAGPSQTYPNAPLAAIIINSQLGKKGKKGLSGPKMASAIEKLQKKRKQSINFVRSGWKNAIRILEAALKASGEIRFVRRNSGSVKQDPETMRKRVPPAFGGAIVARGMDGKAVGEISNNVTGDDKVGLANVKQDGLQEAIDRETRSIQVYNEKKLNPEADKFNK